MRKEHKGKEIEVLQNCALFPPTHLPFVKQPDEELVVGCPHCVEVNHQQRTQGVIVWVQARQEPGYTVIISCL